MIKLRVDSRDLSFHDHFSGFTEFPDSFNVDKPEADLVQPYGNVQCTCYTVDDITYDSQGYHIDIDELFNRVPHDRNGADPRKVFSEVVKKGVVSDGSVRKPFVAYFTAHTGKLSAFNNVRSALMATKYPIACWTNWYEEWGATYLLLGVNRICGHCYTITGWITIGTIPYLTIEAWDGKRHFVDEVVFNNELSKFGCSTAVLATLEVNIKHTKSLMEMLIDALKNIIPLYNELIQKKNPMNDFIYYKAKSFLGRHLTLDESVPKETGCAQAVSYVLKACGYDVGAKGISGTYELNEWLKKNAKVVRESDIMEGDIICSATGTGNGKIRGHVGVIAKENLVYKNDFGIMSNDSQTGLWRVNWSYKQWCGYYKKYGALSTNIYRP